MSREDIGFRSSVRAQLADHTAFKPSCENSFFCANVLFMIRDEYPILPRSLTTPGIPAELNQGVTESKGKEIHREQQSPAGYLSGGSEL